MSKEEMGKENKQKKKRKKEKRMSILWIFQSLDHDHQTRSTIHEKNTKPNPQEIKCWRMK